MICSLRAGFLAFAIFLSICPVSIAADTGFDHDQLTVVSATAKHVFKIELAKTSDQQSRGLMFRRKIGEREGMLFLHSEPRYVTMWMRNTYIPLDMLFIREDGRIHRIESRTEPLSERIIDSGDRVTAVLEIAGGLAQKLKIKPGDMVRHSHFKQ